MLYKNSVKVLFSNFQNVWKSLLYIILVVCFSCLMGFLCINSVLQMLKDSGIFEDFSALYLDFITSLDIAQFFTTLDLIIQDIFETLSRRFSEVWLNFFGLGFVVAFLNTFLLNLTIMPMCDSLNFYMGSLTKKGYYTCFKENLGKNIKIQLCSFFVTLPIRALILFLFYSSFRLFNYSWVVSFFSVFLIIAGFVLLTAFRYALFVSWVPTYIVSGLGIFKSLKLSIKSVFKRFGKIYSSSIILVLTIILLNAFMGLFTLSVGLLVTVPASYLLYSAFGMVTAYENQGMRYYVDVYNVITPNKKEMTDAFKEMRYIV